MIPQHPCVAHNIRCGIVRIAVHFDHDTARGAEKIDNSLSNHILTAELDPSEAVAAQRHPKAFFGLGRVVAHGAGVVLKRVWRDATTRVF